MIHRLVHLLVLPIAAPVILGEAYCNHQPAWQAIVAWVKGPVV